MSLSELYRSRTQKNVEDDQQEILSILTANSQKPLKLINYYKGLPIIYPASIVSIERGIVDLDVRPEQAFAIGKNRSAFIRSPLLKFDVYAQVQYVSVQKQVAAFRGFRYVELVAEQRNCIRMVPDPIPDVVITSPLGIVDAEVHDVSLTGVGIWIHHSCPLQTGSVMPIAFSLKTKDQGKVIKVDLPARLVSITGDSLPRKYKFAIDPDVALDRQLSQYIIQRQIEIIKELKAAIDQASKD